MMIFKYSKLSVTYIVACSLFILFSIGCSENKKQSIPDIREFITDTISLPFNINKEIHFWRLKHVSDSNGIISYLTRNNFILYKYSIPKQQIIDSISLEKYRPIYVDYEFINEDSLFVLLQNYQLVLLTADTQKTYNFEKLFQEHIDSFAFPAEKNNPISIRNNIITFGIATNRPRYDFTKPNPNEILYNYIVQLKIDGDSLKFIGKYNPYDPDILENGYYEFRHHIIPNEGSLTYFYDFQNKIYHIDLLAKDTLVTNLEPTMYQWEPSDAMNYDSLMNNYYLFNYINNRYTIHSFLFDPYKQRSLFFLKKPSLHYKEDGSITDTNEYEFTLFVLDKQMNIIKEIMIPPHVIDGSKNIFLTESGLFLRIAKDFQNLDKNETLYYRINFD